MNKTNKIFMTAVAGLTAVQGVNGGGSETCICD